MDPQLLEHARDAIGFMPDDEGLALHDAGVAGAAHGPLLEVGTYCGKSAIYLGAAARTGEIQNFTGISAPYEAPEKPEVEVHTDKQSAAECVAHIIDHLKVAHIAQDFTI